MGLILVDASVWIEHLNRPLAPLADLLTTETGVLHPFVLGEIALGNLPDWDGTIGRMRELPSAEPLSAEDFLDQLHKLRLQGSLGFVDAHLLAWTVAAPDRKLWSHDRRLAAQAARLGVGWSPAG